MNKRKITNFLVSLLAIAVTFFPSFGFSDEQISKVESAKVKQIMALMSNFGTIVRISQNIQEDTQVKVVDIATSTGDVEIKFGLANDELIEITRSARDRSAKSLAMNSKQAAKTGNDYLAKLGGYNDLGDPIMVTKQNLDGSRNLWSVGWARKIRGYKVWNDFISMTFNEEEGVFGFFRTWSSPEPKSIPNKPIAKAEAEEAAKAAGQIIKKYSDFSAYRLDKIVMEDLMIVVPNDALGKETKAKPESPKSDTKNPRLAWVITFKVAVNSSAKEAVIPAASGFSVWIDAETGACIGASF